MLVENTYKPSINLQPEMLEDYLYVITFVSLIPSDVKLLDSKTSLLVEPLIYRGGTAIFQPISPDFMVLFQLPSNSSGEIEIKEGLMKDEIKGVHFK